MAREPLAERHENEQYFFDPTTTQWAAALAARFTRPCCLSLPSVATALDAAGHPCTLLDIDTRFDSHPGFQRWDITRPQFIPGEPFDLILADPPFFNVSLRQLQRAIACLARHVSCMPVALTYLDRRASQAERAFATFGLQATDHIAHYATVDDSPRNLIRWFANFELPTSG